mmetsp:Transcript_28545/g.62835  ORF Transcript_28545/g.62835 Transcript_28545/m.62835 type:complete len:224 (+) Transcript_28545:2526-3197(+)
MTGIPAGLDFVVQCLAVAATSPGVGRDLGALSPAPGHTLGSVRSAAGSAGAQELACDHPDPPGHTRNSSIVVANTANGASAVGAMAVVVLSSSASYIGDCVVAAVHKHVAHQVWVAEADAGINDAHSGANGLAAGVDVPGSRGTDALHGGCEVGGGGSPCGVIGGDSSVDLVDGFSLDTRFNQLLHLLKRALGILDLHLTPASAPHLLDIFQGVAFGNFGGVG